MGTRTALITAFSVALFFAASGPAFSQYNTDETQQTFDYDPEPEEAQQMEGIPPAEDLHTAQLPPNVEVMDDPVRGAYLVRKDRWKNWVARTVYLLIINVAILAVIISLPKKDEYNLIISYLLSGVSTLIDFWIFLCAVLLFRFNSATWIFILPLSMASAVLTYMILLRVKRSDTELAEIKSADDKNPAAAKQDPRLVSVEGYPGSWPDQDMIR